MAGSSPSGWLLAMFPNLDESHGFEEWWAPISWWEKLHWKFRGEITPRQTHVFSAIYRGPIKNWGAHLLDWNLKAKIPQNKNSLTLLWCPHFSACLKSFHLLIISPFNSTQQKTCSWYKLRKKKTKTLIPANLSCFFLGLFSTQHNGVDRKRELGHCPAWALVHSLSRLEEMQSPAWYAHDLRQPILILQNPSK